VKVASTVAVVATPDAPATGFTDFTDGAVTSGPTVVLNTTSTKYASDWYVSVGKMLVVP
jgi:hypothetical protein